MKKTFKELVAGDLAESNDALKKETIKHMDQDLYTELRQRYFGVSDNINGLVESLNSLNGQTGIFGKDLTEAKKMLKAFDKISLGKYV